MNLEYLKSLPTVDAMILALDEAFFEASGETGEYLDACKKKYWGFMDYHYHLQKCFEKRGKNIFGDMFIEVWLRKIIQEAYSVYLYAVCDNWMPIPENPKQARKIEKRFQRELAELKEKFYRSLAP